jgi:hypothetical protein
VFQPGYGGEQPGTLRSVLSYLACSMSWEPPVHTAPEADRPRLFGLLAEAYSGASAISGLLGYLDLPVR